VKRIYRKWREGKIGKERFLEEKVKFKELVEKKQNEKRKEEEKKLKKIKSEVESGDILTRREVIKQRRKTR